MTVHPLALAADTASDPDEIPAARGELLTHLGTVIAELGHATEALARLHSHPQCTTEILDGRGGRGVAAFIDDATRFSRAAYAVLHTVIDSEGPFR